MEKAKSGKKNYLFTVDIMVEGYSNGIALESLLHILNNEKIKDYQINKGIELGRVIQDAISGLDRIQDGPQKSSNSNSKQRKNASTTAVDTAAASNEKLTVQVSDSSFLDFVQKYKQDNTLVRLTILKGKGVRLSLPCRIVNYDTQTEALTVYHVDEKKVYQFHISEVDEFSL